MTFSGWAPVLKRLRLNPQLSDEVALYYKVP
jgi:hypothetical protein